MDLRSLGARLPCLHLHYIGFVLVRCLASTNQFLFSRLFDIFIICIIIVSYVVVASWVRYAYVVCMY